MILESLLSKGDVLLQIIGINLVLSGDNALIIAMAVRGLPREKQRLGRLIGVAGALLMRIALSIGMSKLLEIPGLHLLGGLLLLYIAFQLSKPSQSPSNALAMTSISLGVAVRQMMIGDAMMSADNVLALAACARGDLPLLALGITLCVPFILLGSELFGRLIGRFPWLLVLGASLLGWVAGEFLNEDLILDRLGIPTSLQDALAPLSAASLFGLALARFIRSGMKEKSP